MERIDALRVAAYDVRAYSVLGRQWLGNRWAVTYGVDIVEQGDLYTRRGIRVGLRLIF